MRRLFVDANVLLFGYGGEHRYRAASAAIVRAAGAGAVQIHASTEVLQEFLHHRMRRVPRETAVAEARDLATLTHAYPLDDAVWWRALDLIETSPIRGRDAMHAATALEHGFTEIVTADRDFASVPGLTPVHPDTIHL